MPTDVPRRSGKGNSTVDRCAPPRPGLRPKLQPLTLQADPHKPQSRPAVIDRSAKGQPSDQTFFPGNPRQGQAHGQSQAPPQPPAHATRPMPRPRPTCTALPGPVTSGLPGQAPTSPPMNGPHDRIRHHTARRPPRSGSPKGGRQTPRKGPPCQIGPLPRLWAISPFPRSPFIRHGTLRRKAQRAIAEPRGQKLQAWRRKQTVNHLPAV